MRTSYSSGYLSGYLSGYSYRVGGSLPANDLTYVTRQADSTLFQAIQRGQFCHVQGPHQVGKSSLRIKTRHQLEGIGYRCATVQATDISLSVQPADQSASQPANPVKTSLPASRHTWDKQLIALIWDSLHPGASAALSQWLEATARLSGQQRLEHFARDLLFPELREKPLVIFMDEIDYLFANPEAAYALLSWIAKCYNLQDRYGEYQLLSFVTLGSTALSTVANSLLKSAHQTFNNLDHNAPTQSADSTAIKQLLSAECISAECSSTCEITLGHFKLSEMRPLQYGFPNQFASPLAALKSIYRWTNGQPFLTQKLCQIVARTAQELPLTALQSLQLSLVTSTALDGWIDRLVHDGILNNWSENDDPVHLKSIHCRLTHSPHSQALHRLYEQVSNGAHIAYSGSALQTELLTIGLVICDHQHLRFANKIYQCVFAKQLVQQEIKRLSPAQVKTSDTVINSVVRSALNSLAKSSIHSAINSVTNSAINSSAHRTALPLAPLFSMR
jgi:hypothetical protein